MSEEIESYQTLKGNVTISIEIYILQKLTKCQRESIMKWSVTLGVNENTPHVTFKIKILKVEKKQTRKGMFT
jgi:hypothetical protein